MATTTFSGPVVSLNGFEFQSDNAYSVTVTAPDSLAADYTFTLPPNDGTNGQLLSTDGNGVTTWVSVSGTGTVTSVGGTGTVNGLSLSGTVTTSGNLTLGGSLNLDSPPAIGGTAAAAGSFTTLTGDTVNVQNGLVLGVQALTGPGAINLTDPVTAITTTGADAFTLANGTLGQIKYIVMAVDGGNGVLTPTTALGFTTITFDAVGDAITLIYSPAGWSIFANVNTTIA